MQSFFKQPWAKPFIATKKIAVLSGGTHNSLQRFGFTADFEGNSGVSTTKIAEQFFGSTQVNHALFVIGNQSLKKVQLQANCPTTELIVYKNKPLKKAINHKFDCYIFSSPSNVQAFFSANKLPEKAKLIAFGSSTKTELKKYTSLPITSLYAYSTQAILDAI